ncbi:MAG: alpha/beta hydrolase [Candidatus Omnitrophica bacterium]|nr:alpha/beta hydrolase [Candidatus Omnitrophota bacterium]
MSFLKFFLLLSVIFLGFFFFTKILQKNNIFFPVDEIGATPKDFNLSFQDIYFKTEDGIKLNGWFVPNKNAYFTLLFFHGNGGNISHRLHKISQLQKLGLNIFLIDYRGYGRSQGKPSVSGVYKDAQASLDYLIKEKNIKPDNIILYGESLGTNLAIELAASNKVGGLILEGAFSSGLDMAKTIYPFIPRIFLPDIFRSSEQIVKVEEPKLFIHSQVDEIVPISLARKLYQLAPEPKQFLEIIGGHNTAYIDAEEKYLASIDDFIQKIKNQKKRGSRK